VGDKQDPDEREHGPAEASTPAEDGGAVAIPGEWGIKLRPGLAARKAAAARDVAEAVERPDQGGRQ
jgi:hypothetical protein